MAVAAVLALAAAGIASWRGVRTAASDGRTQPHPHPTPAPVATTVPSPTPTSASPLPSIPDPTPRSLPLKPEVWPVVPMIDRIEKVRLRAIFLHGQAEGSHADVFAKAGDSITATASFLSDIGCGAFNLAGHTDVLPAIDVFSRRTLPSTYTTAWCGVANSFTRDTVAAVQGWTAADALQVFAGTPPDPQCADPPYDAPLPCELRLLRPSVAIIMFGTNDTEHSSNPASFAQSLDALVGVCISSGVVPILSTIPPRPNDSVMNGRVDVFNEAIVRVAAAEEVPLVNYWRALVEGHGVNEGISGDGIHPNVYAGCTPHCESTDFSPQALRYGFNVRNLTALEALEKLLSVVIEDGPPDASPLGGSPEPSPSGP